MENMIYFNKEHPIYGAFSNFYMCDFVFEGVTVNSVEAVFQAQKTIDPIEKKRIMHLSPPMAKKAGRAVKLRSDWDKVKFDVMFKACYAKFSQNDDLKNLLLSTGDVLLVENTTGWHDNIWGQCSCPRCINKVGQNLHGRALMNVRMLLRNIK